jgi:hypothetical protein
MKGNLMLKLRDAYQTDVLGTELIKYIIIRISKCVLGDAGVTNMSPGLTRGISAQIPGFEPA